jgi:uncharacterized membrane protein YqjE
MATDLQNPPDSTSNIISGIVNDAQELMKQQFTLLKVELNEDLNKAKTGLMWVVLGFGTLLIGAALLCLALAHFLSWQFDASPPPSARLWVWYAVVGGPVAVLGIGWMILSGVKFQEVSPPLKQTTEALEENLEWKTKPK